MTPPFRKMELFSSSRWQAVALSFIALLPVVPSSAVVLQWDATSGTAGVQLGSGTWVDLTGNWRNVDTSTDDVVWNNSLSYIARFGLAGAAAPTAGPPVAGANLVTVSGTVNVAGLDFISYNGTPGVPAFTFAGGTIQIANGGSISLADNTTGGNGFLTINSQLAGQNLILQKSSGTALSFIALGGNNTSLTGSLTLSGANGGIFLRATDPGAVNSLTTINVENLSTFAGSTSATYTSNFVIAGAGTANNGDLRGAIRIDGPSQIFTGNITISGVNGATINTAGNSAIIRGNITEPDGNSGLTKKGNGVLTLSGKSTYNGATTILGGTLALDFSDAAADLTTDIITDSGGLSLNGGNLSVIGKTGTTSTSQTFVATYVESTSSVSTITANGANLTLNLGVFERNSAGALLHINSVNGATIKAEDVGLIGAWSRYQNGSGRSGWAGTTAGVIGIFEGDLEYVTGAQVGALPGYSTTSNLKISGNSEGNVILGAGSTVLNSVTMSGRCDDRTLAMTAGQTLRFAPTGGIQVLSDAKSLAVGDTVDVGQVTAGSFNTGELILSNWSTTSSLTINAKIVDHGIGGASPNTEVTINSVGNTIFNAANTYTGITRLQAGTLEVRNNNALGAGAGITTVTSGAALLVSGNLSGLVETLNLNGTGISSSGALRNVSGDNTISGTVNLQTASTIGSDSGTLLLSKGAGTEATNIITGSGIAVTFTGAGTTEVRSRIGTGAGTVAKTGTGLLILSGNNNFTGTVTISGGVLRMTNANALGTTAAGTSVGIGGTLEITGGLTTAAEALTINGAGFAGQGNLLSTSGTNTYAGTITLAASARINAASGSTLNLDVATGSSLTANFTTGTRTVTFGGEGTINVQDAITKAGTGGAIAISKDGAGTTNLNGANTFNGGVTVSAGTLNLNTGAATAYTGATTVTGGTLNIKAVVAGTTATTISGGELNLDFTTTGTNATNLVGSGSTLTLNGGTLRVTGKAGEANAQTFASLTVGSANTNAAKSTIAVNSTATLTLGTITRANNGHTVNFIIPSGGSIKGTGAQLGTGGILLANRANTVSAYATVNGNDWAAVSAGNIVGGESVAGFYTASTAGDLTAGTNINIANGVTTTTLAAARAVTSIRFDEAQSTTINGGFALTSGGVLVTSDVGANTSTISTSTFTVAGSAAGGDLVIIQNNTAGDLVITSSIVNVASLPIALTKAGAGTLVLSGKSTYSGVTRHTEGTIILRGGADRLDPSGGVLLGGGSTSAKLKLESDQTFNNGTSIAISGTGTDNRIVGGTASLSTLTLTSTGAQDFRNGFLGGSLTNENNLSFTVNFGGNVAVTLGGANTYAGKTTLTRGILDVLTLADTGTQSSLGTGNFDAASSVITLGGSTAASAAAMLRYNGTTNSSTNRVVDLAGASTGTLATAVTIQNNGTGTLKFTSAFTATGTSTTARQLTLSGTNTGINEITGLSDGSAAVTNLIKAETGTWAITGASTHSGTTTVSAGTLLANNATGSATGTGSVSVTGTSRLGGNGFIGSGTATQNISVVGTAFLTVGNTGDTVGQSLNLSTSGVGVISLSGTLEFDIFGNTGGVNSLVNNDILILDSDTSIQITGTLQLTDTTASSTCWEIGDAWQLFDWLNVSAPTKVTGTFNNLVLPTLADGLKWDTSNLYTTGFIAIAAVPEPGRTLLFGFGLILLSLKRKRHKGSSFQC